MTAETAHVDGRYFFFFFLAGAFLALFAGAFFAGAVDFFADLAKIDSQPEAYCSLDPTCVTVMRAHSKQRLALKLPRSASCLYSPQIVKQARCACAHANSANLRSPWTWRDIPLVAIRLIRRVALVEIHSYPMHNRYHARRQCKGF